MINRFYARQTGPVERVKPGFQPPFVGEKKAREMTQAVEDPQRCYFLQTERFLSSPKGDSYDF